MDKDLNTTTKKNKQISNPYNFKSNPAFEMNIIDSKTLTDEDSMNKSSKSKRKH